MHFLETCFFFSDFFFLLKLILGGQFLSFFLAFSSSSTQPAFDRGTDGGGEDRGIVGGSPAAAPRRLEVVVQPVRFFDLTPGTIAGIYAESAGARGGPDQGRHSNVGAGSGTGTRRRWIIVLWHSHRRPAAASDDRRSGLSTKSRGPSFTFPSRCLKLATLNGTAPSGCPPQTTVPFQPHDDFEMSPQIQKATGSVSRSPTTQC